MLAWLVLLIVTPPAQAEDGAPLVTVLSENPDAPFARRLAAELSLFGYRVEVMPRPVAGDDAELLARVGGVALIAVEPDDQSAEFVVPAPGGARVEHERLDPRRPVDTNAAVLAERLRARLAELGLPRPGSSPAESTAPPRLVERPSRATAEPERRLWIGADVGAVAAGVGALPEIGLDLRAFPVPWLSTSAFGGWTPLPAVVRSEEGSADLRLQSAGVRLDVYPLARPVRIGLGAGALLIGARTTGRANSPWLGRDDSVLVPAGLLAVSGAVRLSSRAVLELRGVAGACASRVAVRFGGKTVADLGQPLLGASLGLAVGLF